jgi:hypothetical protein
MLRCIAVRHCPSFAAILQPASFKALKILTSPTQAARWIGVNPSSSLASRSTSPFRSVISFMLPFRAAQCRRVPPLLRSLFKLAPCSMSIDISFLLAPSATQDLAPCFQTYSAPCSRGHVLEGAPRRSHICGGSSTLFPQ